MAGGNKPSLADLKAQQAIARKMLEDEAVDTEVSQLTALGKPDNVPAHVWEMMLDNGEKATELLNELLHSPNFKRLRTSDQVKLIKLAQDRAYGTPQSAKVDTAKGRVIDMTAVEMNALAKRAELPEYKQTTSAEVKEDDQQA